MLHPGSKGLGISGAREGGLSKGKGYLGYLRHPRLRCTGFGKAFNSDKLSLFKVLNASAAASKAGSAFLSSSSQSSCFSLTYRLKKKEKINKEIAFSLNKYYGFIT